MFPELAALPLVRLFLGLSLFLGSVVADVRVRGHFRKDGTYVAPHMRSSPNSTTLDNWSTKGNINPYTGQVGTKNPVEGVGVVHQYTPYTETVTRSGPTLDRWRKLEERLMTTKTGIPPEEVESLLGNPQSKDGPSEVYALTGDTWRYPGGRWISFWKESGTVREVGYSSGGEGIKNSSPVTDDEVSPAVNTTTSPSGVPSTGPTPDQWKKLEDLLLTARRGIPSEEVVQMVGEPRSKDGPDNGLNGDTWRYPRGGWISFWKRTGTVREVGEYLGNGSRTTSVQFTIRTDAEITEGELRSRIKALEEKVSVLEALVHVSRTASQAGSSAQSKPSDGSVPSASQWSRMRPSKPDSAMSKYETLKLLGTPSKISKDELGLEVWFYTGGGWIRFLPESDRAYDFGGY